MSSQGLRICLLGEPEFSFNGAAFGFDAPPRTLPLLAYLLLKGDVATPRSQLAALFWPHDDEEAGRTKLRRHLHHIKQALPQRNDIPYLNATARSVSWNSCAQTWVDVLAFDRLIADPSQTERAIDIYRGDLLPNCEDEWLLPERARRRAAAAAAMLSLSLAAFQSHQYEKSLTHAIRAFSADEWNEEAVRRMMIAYDALGDRQQAMETFEVFSTRLQRELRSSPSPETARLRSEIEARSLSTTSGSRLPRALPPTAAAPFVGRQDAVNQLTSALHRATNGHGTVVFIVGEHGVGKSRLCSEFSLLAREAGTIAWVDTRRLRGSQTRFNSDALEQSLSNGKVPGVADVADLLVSWMSPQRQEHIGNAATSASERDEKLVTLARSLSTEGPIVLILEDFHFASIDAAAAFERLARLIAQLPILLVATVCRDSESSESPSRAVRRRLVKEQRATAILLPALSLEDVTRLLEEMRGGIPIQPGIADFLLQRAGGNPLYTLPLLCDHLGIELPSEAKPAGGDEALDISLSVVLRDVIDVAAGLGEAFSIEAVMERCTFGIDTVQYAFANLIERGIIKETGETSTPYSFTYYALHHLLKRVSTPH